MIMIGERRVYLSPLFHSDPENTNTSFINKIDEELWNSSRNVRVRLLSVYSSVDLPKISLLVGGLRRKSFGAADHKTFFPFSPLTAGRRIEPKHLQTAFLNAHGLRNWDIKIKDSSGSPISPSEDSDIVIELGLSYVIDIMNLPEYLTFNLGKNETTIPLQSFQKIRPKSSMGLVDLYTPRLANIFPPFNTLTVKSSKWQPLQNEFSKSLKLDIPPDFYTAERLVKLLTKFFLSVGATVTEQDDSRLRVNSGSNLQISLHKRLVDFLKIVGIETMQNHQILTFDLRELWFCIGRIDVRSSIPKSIFLTCNLLKTNLTFGKQFKILRMLYPHSDNGDEGCFHDFENIQYVEMTPSNVKNISLSAIDCDGNPVYFDSRNDRLIGTLQINNM